MRKRLLIGCVALSLLGCQVWPLKATLPAFRPEVPQFHKGTLSLRIKWPDRDRPGFHAAAIPLTTQAIAIRVKQGGMLLAQQVLTRTPGSSEATASFTLDAANNLTVEVRAYRESNPDMVNGVAIAQGMATGVNVVPSKNGSLAIVLDARFVPSITGMSGNVGQVGDSVTLTGTNFGTGSLPVSVAFNGTPTTITSRGTDSVTVTVPTGATTGQVVVTADGIPSVSPATYWVANGLTIGAPKADWDSSSTNSRIVLFGRTLAFTATPNFSFKSGESASNYGLSPTPTWSVSGRIGTISASGLFSAGTTYASGSVSARMGTVQSQALTTIAEEVHLLVPTATLSLGYGIGATESAQISAINQFSDGSTSSLEQFQSLDPASMSVSSTGVAAHLHGYGISGVVVSSGIDPAQSVRVPVLLRTYRAKLLKPVGSACVTPYLILGRMVAIDPDHVYALVGGCSNVQELAHGSLLFGSTSQFWCPTGEHDYEYHHTVIDMYVDRHNRITLAIQGGDCPLLVSSQSIAITRNYAPTAFLPDNSAVAIDVAGHRVVRLNSDFSYRSTIAGSGVSAKADEVGSAASFAFSSWTNWSYPIQVDNFGDIFVLDTGDWRKISPDGHVSTVPNSSRVYCWGPAGELYRAIALFPQTQINIEMSGNLAGQILTSGSWNAPDEGLVPDIGSEYQGEPYNYGTTDSLGNVYQLVNSIYCVVRILEPVP